METNYFNIFATLEYRNCFDNSPISQQSLRNGVKSQTILLQSQCLESGTLTDLWCYDTDLVTVEDQLCGLQSGHLSWDPGDLVTGQVQHIQLLQIQQGQGKTGDLVVTQTHFPENYTTFQKQLIIPTG